MNLRSAEAATTIAANYSPNPPRRVGILSIAGALDDRATEVETALVAAGHTALRRSGHLQVRVGEAELRREDVLEFLELYGHEYALVAIRGWSGSQGAESELIARAIAQQCRVLWVPAPGDPVDAITRAGALVLETA